MVYDVERFVDASEATGIPRKEIQDFYTLVTLRPWSFLSCDLLVFHLSVRDVRIQPRDACAGGRAQELAHC